MKRKKTLTIQKIPLDLLLIVGKFLPDVYFSTLNDIHVITLAAVLHDKEMLEYLMTRHKNDIICSHAALSGNLRILKWLIQRKHCAPNEYISHYAARGGNLQMVQYLHECGYRLNEGTTNAAAKEGHLHILQYLHEHGCPWNESTSRAAA